MISGPGGSRARFRGLAIPLQIVVFLLTSYYTYIEHIRQL
jgi:hypothetical protein